MKRGNKLHQNETIIFNQWCSSLSLRTPLHRGHSVVVPSSYDKHCVRQTLDLLFSGNLSKGNTRQSLSQLHMKSHTNTTFWTLSKRTHLLSGHSVMGSYTYNKHYILDLPQADNSSKGTLDNRGPSNILQTLHCIPPICGDLSIGDLISRGTICIRTNTAFWTAYVKSGSGLFYRNTWQ